MASYSTNANVQNLVYGTTNSDLDTVCSGARDIATSMINASLGLKKDLTTVPDIVTRCCTLLAAGIISNSPTNTESPNYWKLGMELLNNLGEEANAGTRYTSISVDGFGRYRDYDDFHDGVLRIW